MRVGLVRRGGVAKISPTANKFLAFNSELFTEEVWFLADVLNADLDEVTVSVEAVVAQQDHQIFDHLLRAGTNSGQRWNFTDRRDGDPLIEIETLWDLPVQRISGVVAGRRRCTESRSCSGPTAVTCMDQQRREGIRSDFSLNRELEAC